jgi:hypothetical protein
MRRRNVRRLSDVERGIRRKVPAICIVLNGYAVGWHKGLTVPMFVRVMVFSNLLRHLFTRIRMME